MDAVQGGGLAWVVAWRSADEPEHVWTRAHRSRADALAAASELRGFGAELVSVDERQDMSEDEVWEAFTARFGPEVRPGVFRPAGHDAVELLANRAVVLRRAFLQDDTGDDTDLNTVPLTPHPRRLGLTSLIDDTEDALDNLDDGQQLVLAR